jgi:hypothetical protein
VRSLFMTNGPALTLREGKAPHVRPAIVSLRYVYHRTFYHCPVSQQKLRCQKHLLGSIPSHYLHLICICRSREFIARGGALHALPYELGLTRTHSISSPTSSPSGTRFLDRWLWKLCGTALNLAPRNLEARPCPSCIPHPILEAGLKHLKLTGDAARLTEILGVVHFALEDAKFGDEQMIRVHMDRLRNPDIY